ncbi:centrosomal protein of 97 kDa [Corchorus olitorius]|uniref:Centrosomal protein of 97 kDa n=1 Tax=Corchorus olitorius TaxID=93759 RepID=A0A1R3HX69_9ROSI|nr:centrosomal protein of 97 kDa [Corchorus olitorius]
MKNPKVVEMNKGRKASSGNKTTAFGFEAPEKTNNIPTRGSMKIEAKTVAEKLNRRFSPYKKAKNRRFFHQTVLNVCTTKTLKRNQSFMAERETQSITILRDVSWTDSDSPTEESEEETDSGLNGIHPRPTPPFKARLSHRIRIGTGT